MKTEISTWDRMLLSIAPRWALDRIRSRAAAEAFARSYEAAGGGRRTENWTRTRSDANALVLRAGPELRAHARDLARNNAWAKRGIGIIANNVVGWGIVPRLRLPAAAPAWKAWSETTECDADGGMTLAGLQHQIVEQLVISGEVLVRRRVRRPQDGLTVPLQLQVLEADHLDTAKTQALAGGGRIVGGVEFDAIGRRVAYWTFDTHPGDAATARGVATSTRRPASEFLHVFLRERPGQARGVSWLAQSIVPMKDLDEHDDAELVAKKIAACFAAFVTDTQGIANPLGEQSATSSLVETFEPGMIVNLPAGRDVKIASPPVATGDALATRTLRRIAAGLCVTYEDLTGDFSGVNFSSARMARIVHQGFVRAWQTKVMIPAFCEGVLRWWVEAAALAGVVPAETSAIADWTVPPLPMIEPDREGLAYQRLVRTGAMTPSEMVREQGGDPDSHWAQYAEDLAALDRLGIKLDSDVRAVSQAGLTQERVGLASSAGAPPANEGA